MGGDSSHELNLSPEKVRKIAVFLLDEIREFSKTEEVKKVASMGDEGSEKKNGEDNITESLKKGEIHHE